MWIILSFIPSEGCLKGVSQEIGAFECNETDRKDMASCMKYIAMVLENDNPGTQGEYSFEILNFGDSPADAPKMRKLQTINS